jgi:hypothetical protein
VPPATTSTPNNDVMELGPIAGVGGQPWIASTELSYGVVWQRSTTGWTETVAPVTGNAQAGMVSTGPTSLVFSNSGNTSTWRYDGTTWHVEDNAASLPASTLFAVPNGPVFAGAQSGVVMHP